LVAGAAWLPLFWERAQAVDAYLWKSGLLIALSLGLVVIFWKRKSGRVWVVLLALLVVRLGFNWFVLPDRHEEDWGTQCKESTIRMAGQLGDEPRVFLYHHTGIQPTNSFYFTSVRQQILERRFHGLEKG
ncbi:hypothetical protein RZS08_32145, partial [Arthrospira platensis SPKY1]|nr:hypothetical protein [Arthrospira platensis SPKY1]